MGIKPAPFASCSVMAALAPAWAPSKRPAVVVLTPDTPHLLQKILTPGYIGTILLDCDIMAEAAEIGKGRRAAAEAGSHRKSAADRFSLARDVKGAAGELVLRWLLRYQVASGVVACSVQVGDAPDKNPDLTFLGFGCEVKTNGLAVAFHGYYDRDDRYLAANVRQVSAYLQRGVDRLLFVYFESPCIVHLLTATPLEVTGWPVEAYLGNTPFYRATAAERLPLGQLAHSIKGVA